MINMCIYQMILFFNTEINIKNNKNILDNVKWDLLLEIYFPINKWKRSKKKFLHNILK